MALDDDRQPGAQEHDVGGGSSGIGSAGDRDSRVGLFQGGRVVHSVAGHAHHVASILQDFHDMVLVLGIDLGEAIGRFDGIRKLASFMVFRFLEKAGVEDVGAEPHLLGDFLADGYLIARDHLHPNSHLFGRIEGRLRVFSRRVIERENGQELPLALRRRSGRRPKPDRPVRQTRSPPGPHWREPGPRWPPAPESPGERPWSPKRCVHR